jgi:hypothetical protein
MTGTALGKSGRNSTLRHPARFSLSRPSCANVPGPPALPGFVSCQAGRWPAFPAAGRLTGTDVLQGLDGPHRAQSVGRREDANLGRSRTRRRTRGSLYRRAVPVPFPLDGVCRPRALRSAMMNRLLGKGRNRQILCASLFTFRHAREQRGILHTPNAVSRRCRPVTRRRIIGPAAWNRSNESNCVPRDAPCPGFRQWYKLCAIKQMLTAAAAAGRLTSVRSLAASATFACSRGRGVYQTLFFEKTPLPAPQVPCG